MKHLSSMLAVLVMAAMASAPAQADSFLPQIGGKGGAQYSARCPQGQFLHGFEVRAGDDIDAIRAVCVTASSPVDIGAPPLTNGFGTDWHGGGGGSLRRLLCPPGTPVVAGIVAGYDGIDTVSLDTIDIYCGEISARVSIGQYPSNVLHAPVQGCTLGPNLVVPTWNLTKNKIFGNGRCPHFEQAQQRCPMGEVGIGMHGHSGALVDAMGLICGPAPALQKIPPAMGHVESAPRLTPLQKAVKGAQLERPSGSVASARIQSSGAKLALNPQPLPPGQPSRDANDKAIIIVGGKAAATRHAADHPARSPGFANGASGVTHDRNQPDNGSSADCLYALDGRGRLLRFTHQAALSKPQAVDGHWNDVGFLFAMAHAGARPTLYGVATNGAGLARHIGGTDDRRDRTSIPPAAMIRLVGQDWRALKHLFSMGEGIVYGVASNGDLVWHRPKGAANGAAAGPWETRVVGVGWGAFTHVFTTGQGVIYAIKPDGTLLWYQHRGYLTGAGIDQPGAWQGPKQVGTGWQGFTQVFAAGNGHIYAINNAGELLYYRHRGWRDGSFDWDAPVKLADGWGNYTQVFAATGY